MRSTNVLNGVDSAGANTCVDLIENGDAVALTDFVLTEILQGLSEDGEAVTVERHLRRFPILRLETLDDYSLAAELYRTTRFSGVTSYKTLDCLIAAARIRRDVPLLHSDADFDRLATCTPRRLYQR